MSPSQQSFHKSITSLPSFWWYMLQNLPSVIFWGSRLKKLDLIECHTTVPFNYRSKNPFRSIYFSALSGTAELASGILCMLHLSDSPSISMLVTGFKADFSKKANQTVTMKCKEGKKISEAIDKLQVSGDVETVLVPVTGYHPDGNIVATFEITWSFKKR